MQKFSTDGTFITKWWDNLHYPFGTAVGPSGNVYVANMYGYYIQKFGHGEARAQMTANLMSPGG